MAAVTRQSAFDLKFYPLFLTTCRPMSQHEYPTRSSEPALQVEASHFSHVAHLQSYLRLLEASSRVGEDNGRAMGLPVVCSSQDITDGFGAPL